jgi:hypothetical protein
VRVDAGAPTESAKWASVPTERTTAIPTGDTVNDAVAAGRRVASNCMIVDIPYVRPAANRTHEETNDDR